MESDKTIQDLPAEILIKIFSYLTHDEINIAGQVSTRFRECSQAPELYEYVIFSTVEDPFIRSFFVTNTVGVKTIRHHKEPIPADNIVR